MGLCYYALGWRKVPYLETTTVTYYHSENTMNKGFDNIGDRLKEDSCFLHRKRIANIQGPAFIMFLLSDQKAQFLLEDKLLIAPFSFLLPSKV